MAEVELTGAEQIALALLRNTPSEMISISRPDHTITLTALHEYFYELVRKLELARIRRGNEYIDVEKIEMKEKE